VVSNNGRRAFKSSLELISTMVLPGRCQIQKANVQYRRRRIGGVPSDRDGLLCIVEKFAVPGRERFFLDSTFHRSGLLGNVLLKGYVSMSSCYISSFKSGTTFGGWI